MAFVKCQCLAHGKCYIRACSLNNKLNSGWLGRTQNNKSSVCPMRVSVGLPWGTSSPPFEARRSLATHSPCSAKRECVARDPSRCLVRPGAAERSRLLQPRWPTPAGGGLQCGQDRVPSPPTTPEPQCCHVIRSRPECMGLSEGLASGDPALKAVTPSSPAPLGNA